MLDGTRYTGEPGPEDEQVNLPGCLAVTFTAVMLLTAVVFLALQVIA